MMFHWPLEFPEVIVKRGGFDAFVGNPPLRHGRRISTDNSPQYLGWLLTTHVGAKGTIDLVVYFVRRAFDITSKSGTFGLILTKSVAEGDNKTLWACAPA